MNNCTLDGNNTSKQAKNKKVKKNYMRNVGHSVSKTIIRKTRKETEKQLLSLRDKILMETKQQIFNYDCFLNRKIIRNILNEKIFLSEDFRRSNIKPGYIWQTDSRQRFYGKLKEAKFVKREQKSLDILDLQINKFWGEVQEITRNYFFDFDYILNSNDQPWAKAISNKKYYEENIDLYQEVFTYLHKIDPSIKINSNPFIQFSTSFIKAIKRNVEEFPDDELTWEAKDEGFVIKKLRRLNKPF